MDTLFKLAVAQCLLEFVQTCCLFLALTFILQRHQKGGQP